MSSPVAGALVGAAVGLALNVTVIIPWHLRQLRKIYRGVHRPRSWKDNLP